MIVTGRKVVSVFADAAALQMNEEQHIERDQSPELEHLHGEEAGPCEHGPVGTDELFPRCCALSLRSRRNAAASEDIQWS